MGSTASGGQENYHMVGEHMCVTTLFLYVNLYNDAFLSMSPSCMRILDA
jgi:hypothetical protein